VGCILLRCVYVYLSNIPAIATENLLVLLFLSVHNMFRPLRAIFRWNTITSLTYLEKAIDITTDPLLWTERKSNTNKFSVGIACIFERYKQSYPSNRLWRPIGLWDVEAPTFFRQSSDKWRLGCQPYPPSKLYPHEDSWYSFPLEADSTPGPSIPLFFFFFW
jgi:hypothetical protein